MLKIGFDAKRIVRNGTGLGAYGRTLVNDLAARQADDLQLLLYAPDAGREDLRSQVSERPGLRYVYPEGRQLLGRSWWRMHGIVTDLQRDGVALYHGLTGELPIGLRRAGIPGVVTIHDLIFLRHPEYYHWVDTRIYAWKFRVACREASRIIAISERTKQDIVELGGVSPERIDVIYQSCNPRFSVPLSADALQQARQRLSLPERFVLSVGSIEERKNVLLLVRALQRLPQDIHLVVVGRHTPYTDRVTAYASQHGLSQRLHIMHGVADQDLQAIYQLAEVFAYPSRYEGFGIPIIEAIFSQLPVVACTGSCLEEAGGPDCLYVGPDDAEAMAHSICQLLRGADGREGRIARSTDYVQRFRGRDVAAQVVDIYRQVLA
jgi:glycosyltransferase involved in cell wall biosynthesis